MREAEYQSRLIARLRDRFPGCFITKSDSSQHQGVPDILILFGDQWAMLEVKASASSPFEPNQEYYLKQFEGWSFARVIYPEIEERVLDELQHTFGSRRQACAS